MTDRDHFAAAALTGLLYPEVDDEFAMPYIVGRAYLWADAMLRERCREGGDCPGQDNAANLDAVPAVKAVTPGTGDTPKPISGCVSDRSKPINGPDPDSAAITSGEEEAMTDEKTNAEPSGASCGSLAWIPVSKRLPESGETVLVWHYGEVQMAWLNHFTNGVAYFVRDTHYNFEPSHWMPLPAPPTDAK